MFQLRRVELIEKERQAVKLGLEAVEKARLHFQRQLMELQEQIRSLGQSQVLVSTFYSPLRRGWLLNTCCNVLPVRQMGGS